MVVNSKPLQKKSWASKVSKDFKWFHENADFFISNSNFGANGNNGNRLQRIKTLYEIYNSRFPAGWLKHMTDPFNTGKTTNTMGQVRPMNILRPNIEFLRGEYPKRPNTIQVVVKGEDGFTAFMEGKKQTAYKSMSQIFINQMNSDGLDTGVETKQPEPPEDAVNKFIDKFKNTLAAQAMTDLELILEDQRVKEKLLDAFKDWLIAGETYSYKDVLRDEVKYHRVSPLELDFDKSPGVKYVQDGDWAVRRMPMLIADVVDRFYDSLDAKEIDELEQEGSSGYSMANVQLENNITGGGKLKYVYHVTWRSFEKIGILTYNDPLTGATEQDVVNEDYPLNPELGESIEWIWRTRWMEVYRIGEDKYVEEGPVRFAPALMNDLGKTHGPYNGRLFSDTHAENISILKMGIPFQIMYMVGNTALERTMAKSRGKVVLIDQNVIPKGEGWSEEKFFSFSEAQGWATINRNQIGADKSYNQYQVLDLGLFDHIQHLIQVMDYCKTQFDEQLGISRQAKAQVTSSDSVGGTQTSIFQSSIITDMIFTEFEQFVRTDMEGLLDCSQLSNINGKRSSWVSSEGRTSILNINPEEYCYAQMGIMVTDSTKENDTLNKMKQYGQALAQNGMPASGLLAIETANNVAKLQQVLLGIEKKQQEIEQQSAASEQEAEANREEMQQQFAEYNMLLEVQKMHEEYNRKEDLVLIQGDINMAMVAAEAGNSADSVDTSGTEALMKYSNERTKIENENTRKEKELDMKVQSSKDKQKASMRMDEHKRKIADKEFDLKKQIKHKEVAIKNKQASLRKTPKR